MAEKLVVDMIKCAGHGVCADLFPERVTLDDWGYPIIDPAPVGRDIRSHARRLSRFQSFEGSGHVWHLVFGARRSNLTNLDNFISLK